MATTPIAEHAGVLISFDTSTHKFVAEVDGYRFQRGRWEDVITEISKKLAQFSLPVVILPDTSEPDYSYGLPRLRTDTVARAKDGRNGLYLYDRRGGEVSNSAYVQDDQLIADVRGHLERYEAERKRICDEYLTGLRNIIEEARPRLVAVTAQVFNKHKRENAAQQ